MERHLCTGSRKGEPQLMKHVLRVGDQTGGIFANPVDAIYTRIRKTAEGFGEKAIRKREPILQCHINLPVKS
jgi:hypothetical protein